MARTINQAKPRIGFIGLGNMGSRMASRLLDAGYPLTVYDRTSGHAEALQVHGAAVASSPRELASGSEIIVTSVTNDEAIREVVLGADGALVGAHADTVLVDMSTVSPDTSRQIAKQAAARHVAMIDAPVSGSTLQAEQGALVIFVGGEEATFARCKPMLETLGKEVFYVGPSGMGTTMKLVVNALLGLEMQAIAEAIALGEKGGLDQGRLLDVLAQTTVIPPSHKSKLDNVRRDEYPIAFELALMHKDFDLVLGQAAATGVAMPATAVAQQMCAAALSVAQQRHDSHVDYSAVVRLMRRLAGLSAG
jgi:3-hydroxyisobutyrate dehydrogenase